MIYAVEKESRLIYEIRPVGEYVMIRPAQVGLEHLLTRVTMLEFNQTFDIFIARFLLPDQLDEEDKRDVVFY